MWAYIRVLTTLVLIVQPTIAANRGIIRIGETGPNVIRIGDSANNSSRLDQPRNSNNNSNRNPTRGSEFVAPHSGNTSPPPSLNSSPREPNPLDSSDPSDQQRWVERQRQLFEETFAKFIAPSIGSTITLVPRIGRPKIGIIDALKTDSVTVDGAIYLRSQLDSETCSLLFAQDWAGRIVKAQVLKEKREYPSLVKRQTQSVTESLQRAARQPFERADTILTQAIAENTEARNRTEAEEELARRRAQHIEDLAQAEKLKHEKAQRDAEAEQVTVEDETPMTVMDNDLAAAVAAGKVSVEFVGKGVSSGDSIKVTVTKLEKNSEPLILSIAPGTRLESLNSREQDMVVAGVRGEVVDERRYRQSSVIECDTTPRTFVLDAYCAEFAKANPSSNAKLSMGLVDRRLARILTKASALSLQAKQAAVWIHTDKADYQHVNKKFPLSESDWAEAQEACKVAQAPKQKKLKRDTVALPLPAVAESSQVSQEKSMQGRNVSEAKGLVDQSDTRAQNALGGCYSNAWKPMPPQVIAGSEKSGSGNLVQTQSLPNEQAENQLSSRMNKKDSWGPAYLIVICILACVAGMFFLRGYITNHASKLTNNSARGKCSNCNNINDFDACFCAFCGAKISLQKSVMHPESAIAAPLPAPASVSPPPHHRRKHPVVLIVSILAVAMLVIASVAFGLWYIRDAAANEKQCEELFLHAKGGDQAAFQRIRRAAVMGNKYAQCSFGICNNMGWCVAENPTEAIKWFRKSAEQGNAVAQSNLGAAYALGRGVPKDIAEAMKYWLAAAKQGDVNAQTFLGIAYSGTPVEGNAIAANIPEAKKWLRKAADQGNKAAQIMLKKLEEPVAAAADISIGEKELVDVEIKFLEWKATTMKLKSGGWAFLAFQAFRPEVKADVVFRKRSGQTQRFHADMAEIKYDRKTAEQCVLLYNSTTGTERPNVLIKITNDPDEWKGKGITFRLVSGVME